MKIKSRKRVSFIVPVTAMSDIAFLLLIFFMVTATLQIKPADKLKIPIAINKKINMNITKSEIFLSENGILTVDGVEMDIDEIEGYYIKKQLSVPDLLVFFNGDRNRNFKDVDRLLTHIRKAGLKKIILVTKHGKE